MTLKELLLNHPNEHISYSQYLQIDEWHSKRDEIIKRDNHHCTKCNREATNDNVDSFTKKSEHFWIEEDGFELTEDRIMIPHFKMVYSDKHYHLEVHHTRYILNRLPWKYKNDDLITLCNHCHTEFHQNNKVPVYSEDETINLEYEACDKCNGTGYIAEYRHVQGGICFQCMGDRYTHPFLKTNK